MEQRLVTVIQDIVNSSESEDGVVVITHKGCLRAIMPALFNLPKENHENFNVSEASITIIDYLD